MNNIPLYFDPILGTFNLEDLINYLSMLKHSNDLMIKRIITILENHNYDDEDIASILKEDASPSLDFIINLFNNNL